MDSYADLGMTAQQQHDEATKAGIKLAPNSRQMLEDLLARKEADSLNTSQLDNLDPVERILKGNPLLTREEVEEMIRELGFL